MKGIEIYKYGGGYYVSSDAVIRGPYTTAFTAYQQAKELAGWRDEEHAEQL